jgi:hypothetical protein
MARFCFAKEIATLQAAAERLQGIAARRAPHIGSSSYNP